MILNMGKYPSLKNCYTHLLKSAIQKLAEQVHHCKLQITHTHKKGKKPQTNKQKKQGMQTKQEKKFEKVSVLRNGPQKMRT